MLSNHLLSAIGELDEEVIRSAKIHQKTNSQAWMKWSALAACLCLLALLAANTIGILSWKSGCGQTTHFVTFLDGKVYYVRADKGLYVFDPEKKTSDQISKASGELLETREGVLFCQQASGTICRVEGGGVTQIASLSDGVAFDLAGDLLYYRTDAKAAGYEIMALDRKTGEISLLLSGASGHLLAQRIIGDKLYYAVTDEPGRIFAYDMQSGESAVICEMPFHKVCFYEEFALIFHENGLYALDYAGADAEFLCAYLPITGALDYHNGKLYFETAICADDDDGYEEFFISIDLKTKETETVSSLYYENGTVRTYTEVAVCDTGYYYTLPSAKAGGLFYHDFDSQEDIAICRH